MLLKIKSVFAYFCHSLQITQTQNIFYINPTIFHYYCSTNVAHVIKYFCLNIEI